MAPQFKLVYIAHQYTGDESNNYQLALRWVRWAAAKPQIVPVAPWLVYIQALNNDDPREKELGMQLNFRVLERCQELWLCGPHMSEGMIREEAMASAFMVHVVRFEADEPPGGV
jgi:hypothetical protein